MNILKKKKKIIGVFEEAIVIESATGRDWQFLTMSLANHANFMWLTETVAKEVTGSDETGIFCMNLHGLQVITSKRLNFAAFHRSPNASAILSSSNSCELNGFYRFSDYCQITIVRIFPLVINGNFNFCFSLFSPYVRRHFIAYDSKWVRYVILGSAHGKEIAQSR